MPNIATKAIDSIRRNGFAKAIGDALTFPFRYRQTQKQKRTIWSGVLALDSVEARFTAIYANNLWESTESVSGPGSTLDYTANLRAKLPELVAAYGIKRIFDAPCGDFNWMRHVLPEMDVSYVGGDIVQVLIDAHNAAFSNARTVFMHIDMIKDGLPQADLMICRDCLFHFSYENTRLVFENFVRSGTRYLLTTTHKPTFGFGAGNRDVVTGDYRRIDLFAAPYFLPSPPLERIDDWCAPAAQREMCLWSREQVAEALKK